MTNDEKISANIVLKVILDRKAHDFYEFHQVYRISPCSIVKSFEYLEEAGIVNIFHDSVSIKESVSNEAVFIMNYLSKTYKPEKLNEIIIDI